MRLLVKGGRIIDPANNMDMIGDVLVEDGVIKEVKASISAGKAEVLDASGKLVCPGFIDMHVHLREPGYEYKETIESGTMAAASGGFTTICCMPNTSPVNDNRAISELIKAAAMREGIVNVLPIGAITKGQKGQEMAPVAELVKAGCIAISDDGKPVMNSEIMRRVMEYVRMFDIPVISHCEDLQMAEEGQMHEGYYSTYYGLKGIPAVAEEVMAMREIMLAEMTGGRLHIAHASTTGTMEMVRMAKAKGLRVSCEVTPHHLSLTDEIVGSYDADTKVNPPLRSKDHVAALVKALQDGTVDCIATDHAPHEMESKDCEYNLASFGISGLETAVAVVFDYLIKNNLVDLTTVIKAWTAGPAGVLGISAGTLSPGVPADITIIDPECERMVNTNDFYSKGKNTPYKGMTLKGWPWATIVAGRMVAKDGQIL
ncbi:MAG: dihydroorotase [Acidobacteriota bacterium]